MTNQATAPKHRRAVNMLDVHTETPVSGFQYLAPGESPVGMYLQDALHITDRGAGAPGGRYHLHIETQEWESDDLAELESRLFAWASADGQDVPTPSLFEAIAKGAEESDLDGAAVWVQRALGQGDGGFAGLHFDGVTAPDESQWPGLTVAQRAEALGRYAMAEVQFSGGFARNAGGFSA